MRRNRPGVLIVPAKGTGKPGEAMEALLPMQREFVKHLLELGGTNNQEAARRAGYGGDNKSLRVTAHRLAHDDKVLLAIREEADKRIRSGALLGASVLVELASDPLHKDRYKAAIELLNRAGLQVVTEHKVTVTNTADERAMVERITAMAKTLGLDPKKLIGETMDAEFTEVARLPPPSSTEGLEDIL